MPTQADIRKHITEQIIAALEANKTPFWRQPWRNDPNAGRPANVISERAYSGINPMLLSVHALQHGFNSRWYATFEQWKHVGGKVQKRPAHVEPGQWGCRIVYYQTHMRVVTDPETNEQREERVSTIPVHSAHRYRQKRTVCLCWIRQSVQSLLGGVTHGKNSSQTEFGSLRCGSVTGILPPKVSIPSETSLHLPR